MKMKAKQNPNQAQQRFLGGFLGLVFLLLVFLPFSEKEREREREREKDLKKNLKKSKNKSRI